MPGRVHRPRSRLLVVLVAAALVSGCGGDDGDGSGDGSGDPERPTAPKANEPLSAAAGRLARSLPGGDCKALIRLMLHSIQRGSEPDAPPSASDCDYIRTEARNELRGYRLTKSEQFATAGFSEGSGANARGGQVIGIVWLLDSDGSWKAAFEAVYRPQIGVAPHLAEPSDANAAALVTALERADCAAIWRGLSPTSRFVRGVNGKRARFCRDLPAAYRDGKSAFAQIKADGGVEPELLGRTRDFGFYALRLKNGRYMDLVLSGPLASHSPEELREHANPSALELLTVRQPG